MAKTGKKSPTIFYWLSLASAAATIVMMFPHWFTLQVTSFGNDNSFGQFGLLKVDDFLAMADRHVDMADYAWANTAATVATVAMVAVIAAQVIYLVWALLAMRRTPPRGILPAAVSMVASFGFLMAHAQCGAYIKAHLPNEFLHVEFYTSVFPFLVIMLAVATVVFALLNRQESRALYAVKHPRALVFPPENPETV